MAWDSLGHPNDENLDNEYQLLLFYLLTIYPNSLKALEIVSTVLAWGYKFNSSLSLHWVLQGYSFIKKVANTGDELIELKIKKV